MYSIDIQHTDAGMPMARDFNEVVAMDIMFLKSRMLLYHINHRSRFAASVCLTSKKSEDKVNID